MPRETTRHYKRIRIRSPSLFKRSSLRTVEIGRKGFHKLIRGRLKSNNEWRTQSVIVERKVANLTSVRKETRRIIKRARRE